MQDLSFLRGKTQADKVFWFLQNYGSITNAQCHEIFGIRHGSSAIRDLRKRFRMTGEPYEITNEPQKGCNRFGEPCHWDKYTLVIKEAV